MSHRCRDHHRFTWIFAALLGIALIHAPAARSELTPRSALDSLHASARQFAQGVEEAARAFDSDARLAQLTPQQRKDLVEFVAGNMLFVVVHEMGHVLITEMGLPVLGREEDAADAQTGDIRLLCQESA